MAFSSCYSFCEQEVELPELHQPPLTCWGSQKPVKSGVFHHLEQSPLASGIVAHVSHCNCIFTCATLWLLHYDCSCAMHSNMTSLAHWHFMSCAIPLVSLKPTDIHILMIISRRLPYWQLWHLGWSYILHHHLSRFQRLYTMVLWVASVSALRAISFPGSWSWEALSTGDQVLKTRNLACFWSSWAASEAQFGFQIYPASLHLWIGGTGIHENQLIALRFRDLSSLSMVHQGYSYLRRLPKIPRYSKKSRMILRDVILHVPSVWIPEAAFPT